MPCCTRDEGGPLGTGVQAQVTKHLKLRWSKARVVSVQVVYGNDLDFSPKSFLRSLGRVTVKLPPMARTRGFSRSVVVFFDILNRIIHRPALGRFIATPGASSLSWDHSRFTTGSRRETGRLCLA